MDSPKTLKPGYQVAFRSFHLVFIDGQVKEGNRIMRNARSATTTMTMRPLLTAAYHIQKCDWHNMMTELVNAIEEEQRDMSWVGYWVFSRSFKDMLDINIRDVRIKIINDRFSRKPGDRIKSFAHVLLKDFNGILSTLIFEVKKKPEMKMLQSLAAETISSYISKKEDIKYLEAEVPKLLLEDLNKAYDEIWRAEGRNMCVWFSRKGSRFIIIL